MPEDNIFEHGESIPQGCMNNQHLWDEEMGHSTVEKDGNLTKLKLRCVRCGIQYDISAPLELNDFIGKSSQQQINTQPQPVPQQQTIVTSPQPGENDDRPDIIKRLLGLI